MAIVATTPGYPAAGIKLNSAAPRWVYFAIFTISGFSGLIYESIWSHYLKLFLGHAAYAQSLVLMIFMGGLALGSWLAAKFSERWRTPILFYAIVEGVIGVIALVFHDVFDAVSTAFYYSILPTVDAPTLGNVLKWIAAALLIVPQSVLLGMTFPLMSTGILRRFPDRPGATLAMLYFTNSIGAAAGVLASGFWLIALVGLPGTILTAGLLNILLAIVVWVLVKLDPAPVAAPILPTATPDSRQIDGLAALFFFAAAITGASSFMYEIGWIRMLSLVLGSTTHAFELMLSAFITGLAFGGLWVKRRIDRIANPVRFSGWVQVLMGVLAIATVPLYVETFDWMAGALTGIQRSDTGYTLFTLFSHGLALFVMVPTTFLAGMTLPLFTHVLIRSAHGERSIGRVYAANTVGAILGVIFAVHVGLPLLGLKNLIALGASLDVLLGLWLLQRGSERKNVWGVAPGAVVGMTAMLAVGLTVDLDPRRLSSGVYRYSAAELRDDVNVLYYEDGKTASISLAVHEGAVTIATNGKPDASIQMDPERPRTIDEVTMVMAGALPLAFAPNARTAAIVGLGSGLTTHTILGSSTIERVDTIEIEREMVIAAQGFGDRVARAFEDERSFIHLEDAKTFFSLQNERYDVIISEPSNPWVSGVASLFSEEFYRAVKNYLTTDGVLVQWVHLYEFNDDLVLSILRALSHHFSDYAVYNTGNTDVLIVAKTNGRLGAPSFHRILNGSLRGDVDRVGLRSVADFAMRRTGNKKMLDALLASATVPANSDFFPFLDLNAGAARFRGDAAMMFTGWSIATLPILEMLAVGEPVSIEPITVDHTYLRSTAVGKARAIYNAVMAPNERARLAALLDIDPAVAGLWILPGEDCDFAGVEDAWLKSYNSLAQATLAFLPSAQGGDLLDAAAQSCADAASDRVNAWQRLYAAVAARRPADIANAASVVMDEYPTADANMRQYAVTAGVLGHLTAGQPQNALRFWEEHRHALHESERDVNLGMLVKVALAEIREREAIAR